VERTTFRPFFLSLGQSSLCRLQVFKQRDFPPYGASHPVSDGGLPFSETIFPALFEPPGASRPLSATVHAFFFFPFFLLLFGRRGQADCSFQPLSQATSPNRSRAEDPSSAQLTLPFRPSCRSLSDSYPPPCLSIPFLQLSFPSRILTSTFRSIISLEPYSPTACDET